MKEKMANFDWYELFGDGADVPEHVGVVKDRTFMYFCNLFIDLVLQMNVANKVRQYLSRVAVVRGTFLTLCVRLLASV
jgi:hypothetical protein